MALLVYHFRRLCGGWETASNLLYDVRRVRRKRRVALDHIEFDVRECGVSEKEFSETKAENDSQLELSRIQELEVALEISAKTVHSIGGYHHPSWITFEQCKRSTCVTARAVLKGQKLR